MYPTVHAEYVAPDLDAGDGHEPREAHPARGEPRVRCRGRSRDAETGRVS